LIAFEHLCGLKINYEKYEMAPLNISLEEGEELENTIGCRLSTLSITYLGVPLHFKKLKAEHWNFLTEKIARMEGKNTIHRV
jgi:hypothetical protein